MRKREKKLKATEKKEYSLHAQIVVEYFHLEFSTLNILNKKKMIQKENQKKLKTIRQIGYTKKQEQINNKKRRYL